MQVAFRGASFGMWRVCAPIEGGLVKTAHGAAQRKQGFLYSAQV